MKQVKSILVIRFQQIGDMILATAMINTLKRVFPDACIDVVLNKRIASLFENHNSINSIISFTDDELHHITLYLAKVWKTVHAKHYDAIIDMRSTVNTLPFALFSLRSYRTGVRKPYTRLLFNHTVETCRYNESMLDHNFKLIYPLLPDSEKNVAHNRFTIDITDREKEEFRHIMLEKGIDFSRPIMIAGVTAKLANKTWDKQRMAETLSMFHKEYPHCQIIFNYAPGKEEENAREIRQMLWESKNDIHIDIQAKSARQLAAMASLSTFYFGNEGGARHIVHAMQKPSFSICSPHVSKTTWLPANDTILTESIAPDDIIEADKLQHMDTAAHYDAITTQLVWTRLHAFCRKLGI